MKDFHFYAPTEVAFGLDSEKALPSLVKKYSESDTVMVVYGGKSAVASGLVGRTRQALEEAGFRCVDLPGVQPNPRVSLVRKGVEICREHKAGLLLAIGGGSVIDTAKAIAFGVCYDKGDVWDLWTGKASPEAALPVGCILTLPAAGSEMSDCSVISNEETCQKLGLSSDMVRPKFAIMNPALTVTLPPYQTACGGVDIMMHTMERYFTKDTDMLVHTAMAEALLRSVLTATDALMIQPDNLRYRAAMMWAGSWSHNDLMGCRNTADFATHKIEHELSAMFDVAHGAGLAVIWPAWARYVMHCDVSRMVSFAVNVMGVENDFTAPGLTAMRGIEALEQRFSSWGMPVTITQLLGRTLTEEEIDTMADRCTRGDNFHPGYFMQLSKDDVKAIYRMANK